MIRFIHLADLHLGAEPSTLGTLAARRALDYDSAFERAVTFALATENDIHAVVIAGDLFDSALPSSETLRFALAQLKRLQHANIPVILAPGNHDAIGMPGSVYADPGAEIRKAVHLAGSPGIEPIARLTLNGETACFYGMAWDPFRSHPPYDSFQVDGGGDYHIAVLHATLENARFADLHSRDVPLNLQNLAMTGMDYIALGHIHAHQEHLAGSIPVVYPGTLEARRFSAGEVGPRFLTIVTLSKAQPAQVDVQRWNQCTIMSERLDLDREAVESEEELAACIRMRLADSNVLLRLELVGTPPFVVDAEALQERLSGEFFYLEILDHTEVFDTTLVGSWAQEETIRGFYIRKLQAQLAGAGDSQARDRLGLALKLAVKAFSERPGGRAR